MKARRYCHKKNQNSWLEMIHSGKEIKRKQETIPKKKILSQGKYQEREKKATKPRFVKILVPPSQNVEYDRGQGCV